MTHHTHPEFWDHHQSLPVAIRELANKNYLLLEADPLHPSLHFKKVGNKRQFWSARVGLYYRALAIEPDPGTILWFWIGPHAEYDRIIS